MKKRLRLKKWVKIMLTVIVFLFTVYVYSKTGYTTSSLEILKLGWCLVGQFLVYSLIWEEGEING